MLREPLSTHELPAYRRSVGTYHGHQNIKMLNTRVFWIAGLLPTAKRISWRFSCSQGISPRILFDHNRYTTRFCILDWALIELREHLISLSMNGTNEIFWLYPPIVSTFFRQNSPFTAALMCFNLRLAWRDPTQHVLQKYRKTQFETTGWTNILALKENRTRCCAETRFLNLVQSLAIHGPLDPS